MVFSVRAREKEMSQRMASAVRRSCRTSDRAARAALRPCCGGSLLTSLGGGRSGGLGTIGAVLGAALAAIVHPGRVQRAPDDVIAHAGQVLHTAATNQDDRVLLQIV